MDWLPPAALTDLRSWVIVFLVVLVGVFVRAILVGQLVPRQNVSDFRTDRDTRVREIIEERDAWRKAHEVSEQTRAIMAQQVEQLLTTGQLTNQLLISLKESKETQP